MNRVLLVVLVALLSLAPGSSAFSHCEIPCGIYDDQQRIHLIEEHIGTIEKSDKMIKQLSAEKEKNYNQIVRWVNNKETHAGYIQDIVAQYFLTQRIKPVDTSDTARYQKYVSELTLLHEMIVASMRAKQSTDLGPVTSLRSLLASFEESYFNKKPLAIKEMPKKDQ